MKKANILRKEILKLKGLYCNEVDFTIQTILYLGFGKKTSRVPPLIGRDGNMIYTWEYTLLIITSYGLFKNEEIICSDQYDGRTIEESLNIMKVIEEKKVINVEFDEETYNFCIFFESDLALFVSNYGLSFDGDVYHFTNFDNYFAVKNKKGKTIVVQEQMEKQYINEEDDLNGS